MDRSKKLFRRRLEIHRLGRFRFARRMHYKWLRVPLSLEIIHIKRSVHGLGVRFFGQLTGTDVFFTSTQRTETKTVPVISLRDDPIMLRV